MKLVHMAAVAAGILGAASAHAANYTETLSGAVGNFTPISGVQPDSYSYTGSYLDPLAGFTELSGVAQGDTIDVTMTLDQPYTIDASPSFTGFVLYLNTSSGGGGLDTFDWTFYDGDTPVANMNTYSTTSGGVTTFGILYPPDNRSFTFTSFTDNITVTSLNTPTVDLDSASFEYFLATNVPEPATWSLMLVGIGGLGAFLRQHRRALAATA